MLENAFLRSGLSVLTALTLSLGLVMAGCSGDQGDDDSGDESPSPTEQPEGTPTPTAPPEGTPTPTEEPGETPKDTDTPGPVDTPPPPIDGEIKFVDLFDGDTLRIDLENEKAAIEFEVDDFTLKAPGSCGDTPNCGHVHLNIDGDAGNVEGAPYNNAGASSPIDALFGELASPTGTHTITLELVFDDHSPTGEKSSVDVDVQFNEPTITITDPVQDENITLPENMQVPVHVDVTDFELAAPGTCGTAPNCGHIHLKIDGDAGNAKGSPYNTAGASEDLIADFGAIDDENFDPSGDHTITVELHRDDHSAYEGEAVVHSVNVKIVYGGDPTMSITSPAPGATVQLGNDGYKSVPITIDLKNFTLKAPGACGSQKSCGHLHLHLDDTDGDSPGAPYNNAGAATTIDANFYWLEYNEFNSTGTHEVSISLHKDDHSAALVNGTAVEASVSFVTTPNENPSISITDPGSYDEVELGGDSKKTVTISYSLRNFTVKAPGACGSNSNTCGHIHAFIDDEDGNADGSPYNNAGGDSDSIDVYFSYLDNPFDEHRVTLELHKDDHSAVAYKSKDGSATITVADFVTIDTVAP